MSVITGCPAYAGHDTRTVLWRVESMQRTTPPFRADHVGSLLRSPALHEARQKRERGEIDAAALKAIEDREIIALIRKQEAVGLKSIPAGEYRRAPWQTAFLPAR